MSEPQYFRHSWGPDATHKLNENHEIVPLTEEDKKPLGLIGNNIVSFETISGVLGGKNDAASKGTDGGADFGIQTVKPGEMDSVDREKGET